MKKNTMMRVASILLVAVLLSTSVISGTFAKYTTSGSATDSARVAKFGVVLTIDGDSSFNNQYATEDSRYSGALSVKSSDDAKVVAPGTSSADVSNGVLTFSISGTPEVATKVDIGFEVTKDIYVKAGTIPNYTVAGTVAANGTQTYPTETLTADYYPVVFTLKQTANASGTLAEPVQIAKGNLTAIKNALETYASTAYYAPNTNLAATFELSWAWSYGSYGSHTSNQGLDTANDVADTFLGNVAVNNSFATYTATETSQSTTVASANYNTDLAYTLTVSVTQVD